MIPEAKEILLFILNTCAERFGVPPQAITGASRKAEFVVPRYVFLYVGCECLINAGLLSLRQLGQFCGGRDHSSIIHAREKVASAINRPYTARDILTATSTRGIVDQVLPVVAEALRKAGKGTIPIMEASSFIERVEKMEKDILEIKLALNGHVKVSNSQ